MNSISRTTVSLVMCMALTRPSFAYEAFCEGVPAGGSAEGTTKAEFFDKIKACTGNIELLLTEEEALECDQALSEAQSVTPCSGDPGQRCQTSRSADLGINIQALCTTPSTTKCFKSEPSRGRRLLNEAIKLEWDNYSAMKESACAGGFCDIVPCPDGTACRTNGKLALMSDISSVLSELGTGSSPRQTSNSYGVTTRSSSTPAGRVTSGTGRFGTPSGPRIG